VIALQDIAFDRLCMQLRKDFLTKGMEVNVGEWQAIKDPNLPLSKTLELQNVSIQVKIPEAVNALQKLIEPNLPWAEDHFLERVCGSPLNPPPSHEWWPFAQKNNDQHMKEKKFSHTYPERMWPKMANVGNKTDKGRQIFVPHVGIRYMYGDLDDVVEQLYKSPGTRQAYLPIWFPEDTGAVHGERVPCTLGYHFLIRQERLYCTYYIRSCDFLRHFVDDVYMAARLAQWMVEKLRALDYHDLRPGLLVMHMASLHVFQGEELRLRRELDEWTTKQGRSFAGSSSFDC